MDDRQVFLFRCELHRERCWTLSVHQRTLEELDDDAYYDRYGIFDAFRGRIFHVARERVASANPESQHEITATEIREAGLLLAAIHSDVWAAVTRSSTDSP